MIALLWQGAACASYVSIPDANLRQAVWSALGNSGNAGAITDADLENLTVLDASNQGIVDLTGLEFALNLADLNLAGNFIEDIDALEGLISLQQLNLASNFVDDIRPLAGLSNLVYLNLTSNGETSTPRWLSDVTPIANLKNLEYLNLAYNRVIEDLGPLAGMASLRELHLEFNRVRDIGPLYTLTGLERLEMQVNEITNISVLSKLPNLQFLNLAVNEIRSIDALVQNTGLAAGDTIVVSGNPLNKRARNLVPSLAATVIFSTVNFGVSETNFVDIILDRKSPIPTQIDLAQFDYNTDGGVDVSDLLRYKDARALKSVPQLVNSVTPLTIGGAASSLESQSLLLGRIDTAPKVAVPAVQVVAQAIKNATAVVPGEKVDVTVSIPPDGLEFLQLQDFPHAPEDELSAISYYQAIDPYNQKDTLEKFLAENRVGLPGGTTADTVYFNAADLGFGRQMHMRQDSQGSVFWVLNHDTVDDAWQSQKNPIATVTMEYSAGPDSGDPYVKFYAYDKNNQRLLKVNLDGRGEKYLPNVCMPCHGGTPRRFYDDGLGGNTGARFIPFDLDTFEYSVKNSDWSRQAQEAEFKKMNRAVLNSLYGIESDFANDTDAATELVEGWYGGNGLPGDFDNAFVPAGWAGTAGESIYTNIVSPNCRSCHIQQSSFQFDTFASFNAVKATVKERIFQEGVMPKALRTYKQFWTSTATAALDELAAFVGATPGTGPGSPVARIAHKGGTIAVGQPVDLDGSGSFFAETFQWSFGSGGISTAIPNSTAEKTYFVPPIPGDYVLRLKVFKDGIASAFETETITVGTPPDYDDVKVAINVCVDCHNTVAQDGGLALDRTDDPDNWQEIIARSVLTPVSYVETSQFLRKGAGLDGHLGGAQTGWVLGGTPSQRQQYDTVFAYLASGAPEPPSTLPSPPTFNQLEALLTEPESAGETITSNRSCLPCHGSSSYSGVDWLFTPSSRRTAILAYMDMDFPENSQFLKEASGQVTHNGSSTPIPGFSLSGDRSKYDLVVSWIQDGAPDRGLGETIPKTFNQVQGIIGTSEPYRCFDCHIGDDYVDFFDQSNASTIWAETTTEATNQNATPTVTETEPRRINLFSPTSSLLYRKPQGQLSHGGGDMGLSASELATILSWVDDGGMDN